MSAEKKKLSLLQTYADYLSVRDKQCNRDCIKPGETKDSEESYHNLSTHFHML